MKISASLFACPWPYRSCTSLFSSAHADSIHVDIMDGVCVPLTGVSYEELLGISGVSELPIHVHLMVQDQLSWLSRILMIPSVDTVFLTVEKEPVETIATGLQMIRSAGKSPAIALWPETDFLQITELGVDVDTILMMTTEAGSPGSVFLESSYLRVQSVISFLKKEGIDLEVGVDGGMNAQRLTQMESLGVSWAVVGRSFFIPEEQARIKRLRTLQG